MAETRQRFALTLPWIHKQLNYINLTFTHLSLRQRWINIAVKLPQSKVCGQNKIHVEFYFAKILFYNLSRYLEYDDLEEKQKRHKWSKHFLYVRWKFHSIFMCLINGGRKIVIMHHPYKVSVFHLIGYLHFWPSD